jgi:inhibitor of cysteine peptidase
MAGMSILAMAAASCMGAKGHKQMEPAADGLEAPVAKGVLRLDAGHNGQTIAVAEGQTFAVALVGVPTAGYLWSVVEKPSFVSEPVEGGGPTTAAQRQPGFTGGNHWETFTFTAKGKGKGRLKLEQRRPWEKSEPASATFAVTIEAR